MPLLARRRREPNPLATLATWCGSASGGFALPQAFQGMCVNLPVTVAQQTGLTYISLAVPPRAACQARGQQRWRPSMCVCVFLTNKTNTNNNKGRVATLHVCGSTHPARLCHNSHLVQHSLLRMVQAKTLQGMCVAWAVASENGTTRVKHTPESALGCTSSRAGLLAGTYQLTSSCSAT